MPIYTYRNKETNEEFTESMTISEWDDFLENHPEMEWVPVAAPGICDPMRLGRMKTDSGFNDILKRIKGKSGKGAIINTRVSEV